VGVEVEVGRGSSVFDGGRLGSATKAQRPRIVARAWEGAEAAVAPKVYMAAMGGRQVRMPKVGKAGDGMVVAGPCTGPHSGTS
jgi:hypothetical protein